MNSSRRTLIPLAETGLRGELDFVSDLDTPPHNFCCFEDGAHFTRATAGIVTGMTFYCAWGGAAERFLS